MKSNERTMFIFMTPESHSSQVKIDPQSKESLETLTLSFNQGKLYNNYANFQS